MPGNEWDLVVALCRFDLDEGNFPDRPLPNNYNRPLPNNYRGHPRNWCLSNRVELSVVGVSVSVVTVKEAFR